MVPIARENGGGVGGEIVVRSFGGRRDHIGHGGGGRETRRRRGGLGGFGGEGGGHGGQGKKNGRIERQVDVRNFLNYVCSVFLKYR